MVCSTGTTRRARLCLLLEPAVPSSTGTCSGTKRPNFTMSRISSGARSVRVCEGGWGDDMGISSEPWRMVQCFPSLFVTYQPTYQ